MFQMTKLPFADWCWQKHAFTDEDGQFPLRVAMKLLGVSMEQIVGWVNSEEIDSLAPIHIEAAYYNPPPMGIKVPRINPWTGAIEQVWRL